MVLTLLGSLAGFIKVKFLADKAVIDNSISRLHHRVTSAIFFLFCLLCTANSLIGNPIECLVNDDKMQKVINTYCWIQSTFTVPLRYIREVEGINVAAPGVRGHTDEDSVVTHSYYQWVPFMLFFQGILFYAPHWLWKNWEDGKIKAISEGVRGTVADTREERKDRQSKLVRYLIDSMRTHQSYAIGFFLCEVLNFINVIGNIYLTNLFLGGRFLTYGVDTISPDESHINPRHLVFPRLSKCTFRKFGSSGTIEKHDSLCVLALNIINEKIYIFLWWWFIILAVITGLSLIYCLGIIISPVVRRNILFKRFKYKVSHGVSTIVERMELGDFVVLHLLGQNINMVVFNEIMEDLANKLSEYRPGSNTATLPSSERLPIYPQKGNVLP